MEPQQPVNSEPNSSVNPEPTPPAPNGPTVFGPQTPAIPAPPPSEPIANSTPPAPGASYASPSFVSQTGSAATSGRSRRPLLWGLGAIVVIIIIAASLFFTVFHKPIRHADITKAETDSETIDNDLSDASLALDEIDSASTADEVNSKISLVSSKLNSAQSHYASLKKSPVLHDKTVDQKFKAIDKKWQPYMSYLQDNNSDLKTLGPVAVGITKDLNDLTANPPTTLSGLSDYLTKFKSIVDNALQQTNGMKLKIDTNQKALQALQTFLQASSSDISAAQHDLSSGDTSSVEDDLLKVEDAESTFETATNSSDSQDSDKQKQLDVSDQFDAFNGALSDLSLKVKS